MPRYSWNTAKGGVKQQSINQSFNQNKCSVLIGSENRGTQAKVTLTCVQIPNIDNYLRVNYGGKGRLWCLTPLSTIF